MSNRIDVRKTYKLFIGGAFPRSESGYPYVVDDHKGTFVANAALASRKDARDAVVAARKAFGGWSGRTAYNRAQILYRVEFDMRYGNQRAETAVATDLERLSSVHDVLALIKEFHKRYGERFGEGSQATENGVRINTVRVSSYVEIDKVGFKEIQPLERRQAGSPVGTRACHFVGSGVQMETPVYDAEALRPGTSIDGPAVVTTDATTYLVEPDWNFHASNHGAAWVTRKD